MEGATSMLKIAVMMMVRSILKLRKDFLLTFFIFEDVGVSLMGDSPQFPQSQSQPPQPPAPAADAILSLKGQVYISRAKKQRRLPPRPYVLVPVSLYALHMVLGTHLHCIFHSHELRQHLLYLTQLELRVALLLLPQGLKGLWLLGNGEQ